MSNTRVISSSGELRVAWDVQFTRHVRTGIGVYSDQLISNLHGLPGLEIIELAGWYLFSRSWNLPSRVAHTLTNIIWAQVALPASAHYRRADVIHVPGFIAPFRSLQPLVVTVYDTVYKQFPEHYPHLFVRYLQTLVPRSLRRATKIITISEATRQDVIRDYGIDPSKIVVTHLGVDRERFSPAAARGTDATLARYGIRDDYVLHVGSLVARKNIPLLLEAIALLKARKQWDMRQVVLAAAPIPGMPGTEAIHATIARLGLAEDVVMTGSVPDDLLPGLYARAGVLALPSLYEGFGLPLIEAMASGTLVVAAASPAVDEVVGGAGLLVPVGDREAMANALSSVLYDPDARRQLKQAGLDQAAGFGWDRTAQQTLDVYREAVDVGASG